MANIEKNIRVFNEALRSALARLDELGEEERLRVTARLSEVVRAAIRDGLDDPKAIATAAIEAAKQ